MKNSIRFILSAMLLAATGSQRLCAQGTAFTYQGRLNDGATPATGSFDATFTLYDDATLGTQLGDVLTNAPLGLTEGVFTVTLDFGDKFTGEPRWLEIAVRTNGGVFIKLSPRQPLTATPHAIFAANAETLTGSLPANQLTGQIASANIGTGSITAPMLAAGAVGPNQLAAGAVTTSALANGAVTAAKISSASNWFAFTIPNPTPEPFESFGYAVAGLSGDRLLIGAYAANLGGAATGAAYLFSPNGKLLATFQNPTPAASDKFSTSVATVGRDRVLIGAPGDDFMASGAGSAYLFSTNGTLITTLLNPAPEPADNFGCAVASVGADCVLIGADQDGGAIQSGSAYLFTTNGTLVTTFTNPTPVNNGFFGHAVASVGADRVLIGAYNNGTSSSGAAYLFATNGTLLTTFTNPTPAAGDDFGRSVASVGLNRVLIGDYNDNTGANGAGAAYLFTTNGTLLTTFTNPTPAIGEFFGWAVAAAGPDRVLISSLFDDAGVNNAGAVYLFNTNGTLITCLTNPTPAASEEFGIAVVALDNDQVLIGAHNDSAVLNGAGAAYLFSLSSATPDLVASAVAPRAITTSNLEDGAVTAVKIGGVLFETQIPNLPASKITSGTLDDARLSANVALLDTLQSFSASKAFTSGAQVLADTGSAAAPSISFNTDANTGIFRPTTDSIALATGGAERLRINSLGDVGIGETSPGARLDVRTATNRVALFNRTGDDGVLVNWQRDGFNQGSISVAAGVVSYNAFSGSHYAWTDETIQRGMLVSLTGQNRRQRGIADSEIIYGVTLTTQANDPRCLGAYLGLEEPRQPASDANPHQIASVGNGELWVTAAGGDIAPGDYLIAAAVPGCAMKDNPAEFAVGHIVARATENVKWQEVAADRDGLKRARINVLFENFERHGHASDPSLRQWIQHHEARTQQLEQENAQLKSRLDRLEKHLSGKN